MHLPTLLTAALPLLASAAAQKLAADTLVPDPSKARPLNITVDVSFPDSAHITPPRLWNDFANRVNISISNYEPSAISVEFVSGAFWRDSKPGEKIKGKLVEGQVNVANLTQKKVGRGVESGHNLNVIFPVKPWLTPADLHLALVAIVLTPEGTLVQVPVFNHTVTVLDKDAPFLLFDPELLFLYTILAAILGGAGYYAYNTWLAAVVPKKKALREEKKRPVAVTTSSSASGKSVVDQSWIPEQHLRKPMQRGRSDTPKGKRPE